MSPEEIIGLLASGREPVHLEMHDGDCALCGNMLFWNDTSGPVPQRLTPAERLQEHADDCPWRMAVEWAAT